MWEEEMKVHRKLGKLKKKKKAIINSKKNKRPIRKEN